MDIKNYSQNKKHNYNSKRNRTKFKNNSSAKKSKPLEATPWVKFKDELLENSNNTRKSSSAEENHFLNLRKQNYNKFLIQEKQKEETVWDNFSADEEDCGNQSLEHKKQQGYQREPRDNKINLQQQEKSELIDANKLTPGQKNFYRKVITKTTCEAKGVNLANAVLNLKRRGVKKNY